MWLLWSVRPWPPPKAGPVPTLPEAQRHLREVLALPGSGQPSPPRLRVGLCDTPFPSSHLPTPALAARGYSSGPGFWLDQPTLRWAALSPSWCFISQALDCVFGSRILCVCVSGGWVRGRPPESGSLLVALCPGQWAEGWSVY